MIRQTKRILPFVFMLLSSGIAFANSTEAKQGTDIAYLTNISYELGLLLKTVKRAQQAPVEFPGFKEDMEKLYIELESNLLQIQIRIDAYIRQPHNQPRRFNLD